MSLYVALANRWLIERTCDRKNANRKTKPEKLTLPNIFPSPISPVFASSIMVSITDSTCENQVLRSIQDIYRVAVRASSTPNISFKHTAGDCLNVQPMQIKHVRHSSTAISKLPIMLKRVRKTSKKSS